MRNERIAEIKATLTGLGTVESELYTNKEIVDKLVELQAALSKGVFEKTHAEHMRERDILIHFEALAKEYGLEESETFLRFKNNMNELGYTIGTFIKGMNGERIARRALKLLSFEKNEVLGHRFRKHGYGLVPICCGERGDALPIRRVAEVLKERWSFVLVMGNADEARRVVVESERPFALVGNGAPLSRFSAPLCAGRFEVRCEKAIPGFVRECVRRRISRVVQFKYAAGAFDVAGQLSYAGIATETVTIPPKPLLEGIVRASFSAMLRQVAKRDLPELFIFTDDYVAQGALMALALAGVRLPDDVAVVTHSNKGITPIWEKPLARLEMDSTAHARAVADAVVDYLDTGVPRDLDLGSVWKNGTTF